jgi:hypothetical protein
MTSGSTYPDAAGEFIKSANRDGVSDSAFACGARAVCPPRGGRRSLIKTELVQERILAL